MVESTRHAQLVGYMVHYANLIDPSNSTSTRQDGGFSRVNSRSPLTTKMDAIERELICPLKMLRNNNNNNNDNNNYLFQKLWYNGIVQSKENRD